MKKISVCLVFLVVTISSCSQNINLGQVLDSVIASTGSLSSSEIAMGLKEALVKGITTGSSSASKEDGFLKNLDIKIPFPPEVQKVENTLRSIGLGSQVDKFVLTLNRGAEEASKEALPIFTDAIREMSITDALGILKGGNNAATNYLKEKTTARLSEKFSPIVEKALDKTQATSQYTTIASAYNKIPLVQNKINTDLVGYATEQTMNGLFLLIAKEEQKIRENPLERTTDLLKKVFGSVTN